MATMVPCPVCTGIPYLPTIYTTGCTSHTHGTQQGAHLSYPPWEKSLVYAQQDTLTMGEGPGLCATGVLSPWEKSLVYEQSVPLPKEEPGLCAEASLSLGWVYLSNMPP